MSTHRRRALQVFLGLLLLQAAWILAVPPYHAIDEVDHAYRAAGVVRGQWLLTEDTPDGRGLGVRVPPAMVEAAGPQCESLDYMQPDNCRPVEVSGGLATVSTAAAPYNPVYYAVVGGPTLVLDGAAADYALRTLAALLNAALLALVAWCLSRAGARVWTWLGLATALTPVYVYSSMVPAPNSLEITTAFLCWASLLAAARGGVPVAQERRLLWLGASAAAATAFPRTLGPFWLALVAAVLVVLIGPARLRALVREHRGVLVRGVGLVVTAAAAGVAWSAANGLFADSPDVAPEQGPVDLGAALQPVVWNLQVIGAFPFRDDPAPIGVYALWSLVLVLLLVIGWRRAGRRERVALAALVVLTQAVPVALTLATASSQGVIWQGRYGLPLAVGLPVLCGILADAGRRGRDLPVVLQVGGCALAAAHVWSVLHVAVVAHARDDVALAVGWGKGLPLALLAVAAAAGAVLLLAPVVRPGPRSGASRTPATPQGVA